MNIEESEIKDPAMAVLGKLYRILHVKPQCSSIFDRGFIWHDNFIMQRVWASDSVELEDRLLTKIHIETDFLKISMEAPDVITSLAHLMRGASLSGPIYYSLAHSIKLRSSVFVDFENQHWTLPLLCLTARQQYKEVSAFGGEITQMYGPEKVWRDYDPTACNESVPNTFDHFSNLPINSREDLLVNLPTSFFAKMAGKLEGLNLLACANGRKLGAYLPFGSGQALLAVSANERHSLYGEGLLILLTLPPGAISDQPLDGELIFRLNHRDAEAPELDHFLGSWCMGPGGGRRRFTPAFITFIPAAWCNSILAENLILSMLNRCVWAQYVIRDGLSRLTFIHDYPVAHDIELHKPLKWLPQKTQVPDELFVPEEEYKLLDQIHSCVFHMIEDICSTSCPIDALRIYNGGVGRNTCDPRDYARNCGLAELRELYLLQGKEVQ